MDSVELMLWLMASAAWMMCGFVAYAAFTADIFDLISSVAETESEAARHYRKWRMSRNLWFVLGYFLFTGVFSLIVIIVATRGFRTGFRFHE